MTILGNIFKLSVLNKEISVQNPVPVDGDSVHAKDIDVARSTMGGFTGKATDFFDNLHSENLDSSGTNPKLLTIHFNRTLVSPLIGMGSSEGGNFSNVKVIGILSGNIETVLADFSGNNTNRTTQFWQFPNTGLNAVRLEFHTTDSVSITNIYIPKIASVSAIVESSVKYATSYKPPYLLNGTFGESMKQAGSLGVPIDFEYTVAGFTSAKWYRSFIDLQDGTQNFDPADFGAIPALANGVQVIIVKDGVETVMETWKSNMDISMTMFDFESPYKLGAYIGRWTISSDIGNPITLFPNDKIICRIQDDLTDLTAFRFRLKLSQ